MRCCVTTLWSDRRRLITRTFLAFSCTSKRRHWSKLSTKKVFFFFFGFIQRKISLSGENIFSLATPSAIIYHIRSSYGKWADNQDWVNQSEYAKCIIRGWEFNNCWYLIVFTKKPRFAWREVVVHRNWIKFYIAGHSTVVIQGPRTTGITIWRHNASPLTFSATAIKSQYGR